MTPDDIPFCGTTVQSFGPLAKWPGAAPKLPWHLDTGGYTAVEAGLLRKAFAQAWAYWADIIDITPEMADSPASALIRAHFAKIDGPSGVLAWSELANNTNQPKTQRYDSGEKWVLTHSGTPIGGIDLIRVACHEIGHVLGLDHDNAGTDALMAPMYSTRIPKPTVRDAQRIVGLGYKKRTAPQVPDTPDPNPVIPKPVPVNSRIIIDPGNRIVTVGPGWSIVRDL